MISLALAIALHQDTPELTPCIYRCPAAEGESDRFPRILEDPFDSVCIDPKPGVKALRTIKGKLKVFEPKAIDTPENMKWRDATIEFASGKISPKAWLYRTSGIHATVHFLSSPRTKTLRDVMAAIPVPPGGAYSSRSVFAEMILLSTPGRPCLTSTDVWLTHVWPDNPKFESWILAMNDWSGPMLTLRHDNPEFIVGTPTVVRADAKPGMLILKFTRKNHTHNVYFNNSDHGIELPATFQLDKVLGFCRGLNVDGPRPVLNETGFVVEEI